VRHGNSRSLDRRANWLEALAVFGLAAAVLLHYISLNAPPFWDELYHLLAARSWLTEGTFRIVDGEYRRGAVVTITTGLMYRVFGESLFVARILPALFGCIWVLVVFLWTRRVAGRLEAWIVAVLLIGSSWMLELSGMVRFYSLHGITFWIGAIALWTAVRATGWRARLLWGGVAVAALYLACSIYLLSVIGVGGLVLWAFVTVLVELPKEKRGYALLAAAGLVAASVLVLVGTGQLSVLLGYYAWSPKWAVGRWDSDLFYHRLFELFYPTLYTLLPLGAAFAIARKPRVGTMALIVFGVVVLVASFAGVKALRYVFYAVPFFFLIWAITVAELLPSLSRLFSTAVAGVIGAPMNGWRQRGVEVAALTATGLFIIATNGAFTQTYRLLTGSYVPGTHPTPDWSAAADSLRALSTRAEIVVTSNSLQTLYYIGDYDVEYQETLVDESSTLRDFGVDYRTGRQVVGTPESLALIMSCFQRGLVFAEEDRWRHETRGIDVQAADMLVDSATEVALPGSWHLKAYTWNRPVTGDSVDCGAIRTPSRESRQAR
jgi:hypothetical protein